MLQGPLEFLAEFVGPTRPRLRVIRHLELLHSKDILSLEMFDFLGVSRQGISVAAGSTYYYYRVKLKVKSEKTLSAGASGGILGWAVAASAAGKAEPDGVFEFVVISDGKKAILDLSNASK